MFIPHFLILTEFVAHPRILKQMNEKIRFFPSRTPFSDARADVANYFKRLDLLANLTSEDVAGDVHQRVVIEFI